MDIIVNKKSFMILGRYQILCALMLTLGMSSQVAWSMSTKEAPKSTLDTKTVEGTYRGHLMLKDGKERQIPLAVSLDITNQNSVNRLTWIFDTQKTIFGSFLIDDEGGPYAMGEVAFNLESGKIDLFYYRPTLIGRPALSLNGVVNGSLDVIKGSVSSATHGNDIGTFELKKETTETALRRVDKYIGMWKGTFTYTATREVTPMELSIDSSLLNSINPADNELDVTENRGGSVRLNTTIDTPFMTFSKVSIDYFRRTMQLTYQHPSNGNFAIFYGTEIVSSKIDGKEYMIMRGYMDSTLGGRTGTFEVRREVQ